MLTTLTLCIIAYLFGSFSSAVIVCHLMGLPDPRTQGSGNPGATNVLRHGGKKAAIITLFFDVLKGIVAVLLARIFVPDDTATLAGVTFAVFLGHLYPVFFQFKGGKGVATAFGALLALVWQVGIAALVTWLAMAFAFRYSSLSAIITAVFVPVFTYFFSGDLYYTGSSLLISILLIWRHRSNIKKLLNGEEDKIGEKA